MTTTIDEAAKAADWYQQMAVAMRQRDNCLAAIERWKGKLAEAEQHIADLARQINPEEFSVAAAIAAPQKVLTGVDPSWSDSAE